MQDEYVPDEHSTPTTWTDSFMHTLQTIVESHALIADDAHEIDNSNRRTIENITVEVFRTLLMDHFSLVSFPYSVINVSVLQ